MLRSMSMFKKLALISSAAFALALPARAADDDVVRTWFKDGHWTVLQTRNHASRGQSCHLPGVQGTAIFSLSQNDKGDDPSLTYQERGARWTFGGVRLQIDGNAPWGVEPLAFQQEPDLLVVPLLPAEAGARFLAEFQSGRTLSITPRASRQRNLSLAGSDRAFDKLSDCLRAIHRDH